MAQTAQAKPIVHRCDLDAWLVQDQAADAGVTVQQLLAGADVLIASGLIEMKLPRSVIARAVPDILQAVFE